MEAVIDGYSNLRHVGMGKAVADCQGVCITEYLDMLGIVDN